MPAIALRSLYPAYIAGEDQLGRQEPCRVLDILSHLLEVWLKFGLRAARWILTYRLSPKILFGREVLHLQTAESLVIVWENWLVARSAR